MKIQIWRLLVAAAVEASRLGLSVVVLDEQRAPGGQIYRRIESAPPALLAILGKDYAHGQSLAAEFRSCSARYLGGALVWNLTPSGIINYQSPQGSGEIRAKFVLIASGAMERPFPIKGWTLPGVMGAGAGQILLKDAQLKPKQPVILAGCGPLLYLLAWQYLRANVPIKAVVDTTAPGAYAQASRHFVNALKGWRDLAYGIKLLASIRRHKVAFYHGADRLEILGHSHCEGVRFLHRRTWRQLGAPLVLLHHGVVPNVQLSRAVGAEHHWDEQQLCWQPVTDEVGHIENTALFVAGDSRKIVGAKASALQGRIAALAIAQLSRKVEPVFETKNCGKNEELEHFVECPSETKNALAQKITHTSLVAKRIDKITRQLQHLTSSRLFLDVLYRPRQTHLIPADDVFVCRCEEVSAGRLRHDLELGCLGPNQLKAFSRCGMGPCQGRLCGLTVTQLIAEARQVPPQEVGYYRIRPPIKPVSLGDLANSRK